VDRVTGLDLVALAVDLELHPALEHDDQLLAGMVHRHRAGIRERLHDRLGARHREAAVPAGQVAQLEPLLGRVDLRALVAADHVHVRVLGLVDEVRHALAQRGSHLHQRRDGRRHAALLDLVDGGGRETGPLRELGERPSALAAGARDFCSDP
jgi:hypothetical protein